MEEENGSIDIVCGNSSPSLSPTLTPTPTPPLPPGSTILSSSQLSYPHPSSLNHSAPLGLAIVRPSSPSISTSSPASPSPVRSASTVLTPASSSGSPSSARHHHHTSSLSSTSSAPLSSIGQGHNLNSSSSSLVTNSSLSSQSSANTFNSIWRSLANRPRSSTNLASAPPSPYPYANQTIPSFSSTPMAHSTSNSGTTGGSSGNNAGGSNTGSPSLSSGVAGVTSSAAGSGMISGSTASTIKGKRSSLGRDGIGGGIAGELSGLLAIDRNENSTGSGKVRPGYLPRRISSSWTLGSGGGRFFGSPPPNASFQTGSIPPLSLSDPDDEFSNLESEFYVNFDEYYSSMWTPPHSSGTSGDLTSSAELLPNPSVCLETVTRTSPTSVRSQVTSLLVLARSIREHCCRREGDGDLDDDASLLDLDSDSRSASSEDRDGPSTPTLTKSQAEFRSGSLAQTTPDVFTIWNTCSKFVNLSNGREGPCRAALEVLRICIVASPEMTVKGTEKIPAKHHWWNIFHDIWGRIWKERVEKDWAFDGVLRIAMSLCQDGRNLNDLPEEFFSVIIWMANSFWEFMDEGSRETEKAGMAKGTLTDKSLETPFVFKVSQVMSSRTPVDMAVLMLIINMHRHSFDDLAPKTVAASLSLFLGIAKRTRNIQDLMLVLELFEILAVKGFGDLEENIFKDVVQTLARCVGAKGNVRIIRADFVGKPVASPSSTPITGATNTTDSSFSDISPQDLLHRLKMRALEVMKFLLVHPTDPALACLRKTLVGPSSPIPVTPSFPPTSFSRQKEKEREKPVEECDTLLIVGALKCLGWAKKQREHDARRMKSLAQNAPSSSAQQDGPGEGWPAPLDLGLHDLLVDHLKAVVEWREVRIDAEVLSMVDKMLEAKWNAEREEPIGGVSQTIENETEWAEEEQGITAGDWAMTLDLLGESVHNIRRWEEINGRPWVLEIAGPSDERTTPMDHIGSPLSAAFDPRIQQPEDPLNAFVTAFEGVVRRVTVAIGSSSYDGPDETLLRVFTSISAHLSEASSLIFLDQCDRKRALYPPQPAWVEDLIRLISAFYVEYPTLPNSIFKKIKPITIRRLPRARRRVLAMLKSLHEEICTKDAFDETQREALVSEVLLPLLEQTLPVEYEVDVASEAVALAIDIVRYWLRLEVPPPTPPSIPPPNLFDRLCKLFLDLTKGDVVSRDQSPTPASSLPPKPRRLALSAVLGRIPKDPSPSSLKSTSTLTTPLHPTTQPSLYGPDIPVLMMSGLVSLFHTALDHSSRASLIKAVDLFRSMLDIIAPPQLSDPESLPDTLEDKPFRHNPVPVRARLVVLQWLMRLRAGPDHQIHIVEEVDVAGLAEQLGRCALPSEAEAALSTSLERDREDSENRRGRSRTRGDPNERYPTQSRGRSDSRTPRNENSPSRGRWEANPPLWGIPDVLPFLLPERKYQDPVPNGRSALVSFDNKRMKDYDEIQTDAEREASGKQSDEITDASLALQTILTDATRVVILPTSDHFQAIIRMLRYESSWELISYVLCYLPSQLSNKYYSTGPRASQQLTILRRVLCDGLQKERLSRNLTLPRHVKSAQIYSAAYQSLVTLLAYPGIFGQAANNDTIQTFVHGLRKSRETVKPCIHALTISCYELDQSMTKYLPEILRALSEDLSMSRMPVHILEFIGSVGQLPHLYSNFTDSEYHMVFAIALQYVTLHKEQQVDELPARWTREPADGESGTGVNLQIAFRQYVFLLAYYVVVLWFVGIPLSERRRFVPFITERLVQNNTDLGSTELDEPTEVCLDMLARYAYANADPRPQSFRSPQGVGDDSLNAKGGKTKTWIVGNAALTVRNLGANGATSEVTIRRPSGTVRFTCENLNLPQVGLEDPSASPDLKDATLPLRPRSPAGYRLNSGTASPGMGRARSMTVGALSSHTGSPPSPTLSAISSKASFFQNSLKADDFIKKLKRSPRAFRPQQVDTAIDPAFFLLQLCGFPEETLKEVPVLVEGRMEQNLIQSLDLTPVVEFHKIAVLYVGPGQTTEDEILQNVSGSDRFVEFLSSLGQLIPLNGTKFFVGGLDTRTDQDGVYTYVWNDNIAQAVFHVACLMPTLEDQECVRKKMHIGNDYIKIIFNESGQDFSFDTISTAFNFVNIVIEPHTPAGSAWTAPGMTENTEFYKVLMQRREDMPEMGPLGHFKMVSFKSLPNLVRQLSLHANLFAGVFQESKNMGVSASAEYRSSWRVRLQEIKRTKSRAIEVKKQQQRDGDADADGGEMMTMEGPLVRRTNFTAWCS